MTDESVKNLIQAYGEAERKYGEAIAKEKGFVVAAESVYVAHQALLRALGIEDKGVPPYSMNVQPWEKKFGL